MTGPDLFLFTLGAKAGAMEIHAGQLVEALALKDPLAAGFGHALILAGRNLDWAAQSNDSTRVDRALGRWVELLGKLDVNRASREAERGDADDAGTEFDRYARAVAEAESAGPPGVLDSSDPG